MALLFAGLFVFAVLTQLGVGWYQRRATARSHLWEAAGKIRQELRYSDHWDLQRYWQADLGGRYYILNRSGLIIDIQGFVAELQRGTGHLLKATCLICGMSDLDS